MYHENGQTTHPCMGGGGGGGEGGAVHAVKIICIVGLTRAISKRKLTMNEDALINMTTERHSVPCIRPWFNTTKLQGEHCYEDETITITVIADLNLTLQVKKKDLGFTALSSIFHFYRADP